MTWYRRLAQAIIGALGIVAIVGSGGGGGEWCFDYCGGEIPPPPPLVDIRPSRVTAPVGGTVGFTAIVIIGDQPSFSWCRQEASQASCVNIVGATEAQYTLNGVSPGDGGARFRVAVTDRNGTSSASVLLLVSPQPAVAYQDGEFFDADWTVTAVADPIQSAATYVESRQTTGGNPDAFRTETIDLPSGPVSLRLFYSALSATYDPASQGAILSLDFAEDCVNGGGYRTYALPMFEQGGHRYTARNDSGGWRWCGAQVWQTSTRPSLQAEDFELVDGPACAATESCPDFSGAGAPLRFGYVSLAQLQSSLPAGTTAHFIDGIDNWKVSVWRR